MHTLRSARFATSTNEQKALFVGELHFENLFIYDVPDALASEKEASF